MKTCLGCKWASWKRTESGRLHPSGDGRCTVPFKMPVLSAAFYWLSEHPPRPLGGFIGRRKELKDHCPHYAREESATVPDRQSGE